MVRTQALLRERLRTVFPYTRAVCFAFQGDGALPAFGASTVGLLASPLGHGPLLAGSVLFPGRAGD